MTPAFSSASSGRLIELCSRSVVTTWSPGLDDAFDREVQPVGAIEREDPPLGAFAAKELVERVPGGVERLLGLHRHPVPGPAGIGQAGAGEPVERLIDHFGLGKASSGPAF